VLGDDYRVPAYFPAAPYALDYSGFLHTDYNGSAPCDTQEKNFWDLDYLKPWSLRLSLEDGNDFRGLDRLAGQFFLDTTWRVGLRANWNWFLESLGGGRPDEAVVGDADLMFRFAQSERVVMHAGLGFRMLSDSSRDRYGVNFAYGADFFPVRPLVLSPALDVGNVGSLLVLHGRATAGLVWGRWEVFAGYDFLRIGSVNLQGPLVGLRLWL
jgi:hypothetical protein